MNVVDIISLSLLVLLALRVAFRGFVKELASLASLVLGCLGGFLFSGLLSGFVAQWVGPGPQSQVLAFVIIFLGVFLVVQILRASLTSVLEGLNLSVLDHLIGFALGFVEGILLVFILVFLAQLQDLFPLGETLTASYTWQLLSPFIPHVETWGAALNV